MQKSYNGVALPEGGEAIQYVNGKYQVPDHPIVPYI
jgi:isocitrate dehydrogenase